MFIRFKRVSLNHDMTVTLEMWDPSGLKLFYQKHAAIVVYDITQRYSFKEAKELVDVFPRFAKPGAFVVLVGNKADLEGKREVSFKVSNVAMFL